MNSQRTLDDLKKAKDLFELRNDNIRLLTRQTEELTSEEKQLTAEIYELNRKLAELERTKTETQRKFADVTNMYERAKLDFEKAERNLEGKIRDPFKLRSEQRIEKIANELSSKTRELRTQKSELATVANTIRYLEQKLRTETDEELRNAKQEGSSSRLGYRTPANNNQVLKNGRSYGGRYGN